MTDDELIYDWYCECCDIHLRSPVLALDDWNDGLPNAVGPDCPECECEMEVVENGKETT